jgi:hypothetical protein
MQENFHLFLANSSTAANCCARCCDLSIMIRVEEKKENHMVEIQ